MKKAFFLPLLLSCLPLVSCGNQPANMGEVNKLKALLSKQDLSPVYDKMFVSSFTQNYDVFSSTQSEEDAETRFYSYRGGGIFGCFYEVSEAAYKEVEALPSRDFFDYLARGTGSYGMVQTAEMVSYHYDDAEADKTVDYLATVGFLQRLEAYFGESEVQVYNTLSTKDDLDGAYDHRQLFNGIIDKKTLFDTITVRAFSDIFARTNLFDGQRSCEAIDSLYYAALGELSHMSDKELSDFISANGIAFEESETSTLVHFRIEEGRLRALLDEEGIIPGAFEGTLAYDKQTGAFNAFDYEILHLLNEVDQATGSVHTASMEFKANGYSWNKKFDDPLYIEPNPTVYEDAELFLEDVVREVIPPSI